MGRPAGQPLAVTSLGVCPGRAVPQPAGRRLLRGAAPGLERSPPSGFAIQPLWMSAETQAVFSAWWGPPAGGAVHVVDEAALVDAAWQAHAAWALVPFEQLEPRWKVLRVDGLSPYDPALDLDAYPLAAPITLSARAQSPIPQPGVRLPGSNYDRSKMTLLAMTGVTALARGTARLMNAKGVLYPARDIGAWLRASDLVHVSSEVSFNPDCPPAKAALEEALFCSPPDYIQLLDQVHAGIIELTGNHNNDRGTNAYLYSLDLFRQHGMQIYGGGLDLTAARKPLLVENNGNRLAFLGCNMAGPTEAWATPNSPGAATCDVDALIAEVSSLRESGVLPIVTFQAFETQDYMPAPMQRPTDFLRVAEAGAVVVSGSQAHVAQGFKFSGGSLIHYGLGNLFFDQTTSPLTSQAFIDRHVFYAGRYLGVDLYPILIEEQGKPRAMTAAEKKQFLETIFKASGWLSTLCHKQFSHSTPLVHPKRWHTAWMKRCQNSQSAKSAKDDGIIPRGQGTVGAFSFLLCLPISS